LDTEDCTYISGRTESNAQEDFFKFVVECVQGGYLTQGDTLVCDNASVHGGSETLETLLQYLKLKGVKLVYLPTYSPELNPCELIFAQVKRYLREHRNLHIPLIDDIIAAFSLVTHENIQNYYNKCCSR
jgi:transposase